MSISTRLRVVFVVALLTVGLLPARAEALNLVDEREVDLDLIGIANGTYAAEIVEDGGDRVGPFVSLARLKLKGEFTNVGEIALQVEGASGTLQLLDAKVTLDAGTPFYIAFGRFRPAVSAQLLISAPNVYTSSRALLSRFAPDRAAGVELGADMDFERIAIETRASLFQPPRASFEQPQGQLLVARTLLEFPVGVGVHAGYAQHVFTENRLPGGGRVVDNDLPLDAAFLFDRDRTYAHLEGLVVVDAPGDQEIYGLQVLGAHRFGREGRLNVEPTVAYDFVDNGDSIHRATFGGNTYFLDSGMELQTHYELTFDGDRTIHGLFVALQAVI